MKRQLYSLMLTILVVVMSELQIAGMMPAIADDFGVSTGQVGLLVSLYALGMAIGGPLLAFVFRHSPPKRALLTVVAAYAVLEVMVPLVHAYWWVALVRILTGCLAGAGFGLSVTFGARLAPRPEKIGEAISVVLGGIMVGTVIGLPLSHFIAGRWGWQSSFYVLGAAAFLLFVISTVALPPLAAATQDDAAQDVRNLRSPRLWSRYLVSLLTVGAAYASFSYFTPLLEQSAGFATDTTTLILLGYGLCSYVGNLIVGKFADQHAVKVLRFGHMLLFVSLGLLALRGHVPAVALGMVLVVGLAGVTMNPALVTRVAEVGGVGNLVSTVHTAVITMGVTLGTAISAITISLFGEDPAVAMWTGAAFAVLAALVLATQTRRTASTRPIVASLPAGGEQSTEMKS
ncbi:MFS transporter [Streptomyces pristinaespiralis]|uniref:Major facilitator superfamily transporter n=2 Tax=Streptomyces pristinaespiralis TaxID=38300 RepID=B5H7I0_STRE2|nr:major facilitator superfamily transporter [Streptomyces pristinaespiralis]EDY62791.1 major facilitator superfamily transporter [Streptomyces pristinaespiralis ATCC 25486]QMU18276.1 MFS transporter [Streptomyces pristinaespiralis]